MDGRNNVVIAAVLQTMAQAMQHQPNDGSHVLETFQRNHLPISKVNTILMERTLGSKRLKGSFESWIAQRHIRCGLVCIC